MKRSEERKSDGDEPAGFEAALVPDEEFQNPRKAFASNIECVVSIVANVVGLGNVWRFPYLCHQNGGGAFFIPYVIMLVAAAMPLLALEMSWGQYTSKGARLSWGCYRLLGGNGLAAAMISFLITSFYVVLGSYALFYLGMAFYFLKDINSPSWYHCNNSWNTPACKEIEEIKRITSNITLFQSSFNLPTAEFWENFISEDSGSADDFGYPNWKMVICLFISWGILLATIFNGAKSMGKANYFFAIFPYFCIAFLTIGVMFQDGAAEGLMTYLVPNFRRILETKVWADAGQQIFFSLSLTQGVIITLSSFNNFHQNCFLNAIIVVIINCMTSFWVGMPIFMALGHMAHQTGVGIEKVVAGGPSLAFIAYPQALSLLPGAAIWGVIFCFMLVSIFLGTACSFTEAVIGEFVDSFPILRKNKNEIKFRCLWVFGMFLLGLPYICGGGIHLLAIVDAFSSGINSYIIGFINLMGICYLYGYDKYERDMIFMVGYKPSKYWKITWKYLAPIVLGVMGYLWIIDRTTRRSTEPFWLQSLGWMITCSTLIWIPLYALYMMCKGGLSRATYRALTKPNQDWVYEYLPIHNTPAQNTPEKSSTTVLDEISM